jgi:hypothetical protein
MRAQHGNGQLRPASPQLHSPPSSSDINSVSANKQPPLTLQAFYESLPRPFPESFESKDVNEFGAPGYMNTLVQNARGGKLTTTFIFASDGTSGRTYSRNHAHGYNLLYLPLRSESTISPSGPIPYPANAIDSISSPPVTKSSTRTASAADTSRLPHTACPL